MGKKIWLSMHPGNFGSDLLSRDRTPVRRNHRHTNVRNM